MPVITKKDEKVKSVLSTMNDISDFNEFKKRFIETYPTEWEKIKKTYAKEEKADVKGKGHPMPHPDQYLRNAYNVGLKKHKKI